MKSKIKTKIYYLKKSLHYIRKYKKLGVLVIVFSILSSIFDGASIGALIPILQSLTDQANIVSTLPLPYFITEKIDFILNTVSQENILIVLLIFTFIMIILKSTFTYLSSITSQKTSSLIRRDLMQKMFSAITEADFRYYNFMRSGDILNSINTYAKGVVSFIFILLTLILKISRITVYIIILFLISWKLTLVALALEITLFPILRLLMNKIKNINISINREMDIISSKIIGTLNSLPLIKISSTEQKEQARFNLTTNKLADLAYKEIKFVKLTPFIMEIIVFTFIIVILTIIAKISELNIITLLPFIIAYLYVFLRLFQEFNSFLTMVSSMFQNEASFQIYESRLNQALKQKEKDGLMKIEEFKKEIKFNNVSLKYDSQKNILNNINLTIPKKSFTALIGPTGVGKTTIVNLITGLLTPTSGDILIDGQNLIDINKKEWRKHIGYISQDPIILNETIAFNISYGSSNTSISEIKKAAQIANIHDFIISLSHNYNTILGERGSNLSGGQRQRIAIARAIIRNPEILILDEATSALDTKTETEVQIALERAMENKTVIAIAHRLSTIKMADNIIVLEKGKIIEQGNHEDLINKNGLYKKYYELQFKN